jgi:hypothetical protein
MQELHGNCLLRPGVDRQPEVALQQHHALERGQMITSGHATSDAWGAILRIKGCLDLHTSGFFSLAEGLRWQNIREALGVKYAIQAFWSTLLLQAAEATALDPLRVLIKQDNMSVVSYIRKMGGPKAELSREVEHILQEGLQAAAEKRLVKKVLEHVFGEQFNEVDFQGYATDSAPAAVEMNVMLASDTGLNVGWQSGCYQHLRSNALKKG